MFLSQLAADMVLNLSDSAVEDCVPRMDEFWVTPVYERSAFLYILISALTLDYIEEKGLKKGDPLHEALCLKLGKLAKVFAGESFDYNQLCRYYDSGIIPVGTLHIFPYSIDDQELYELPKGRVGNLITMLHSFQTEVLDGSCGDDVTKLYNKAVENLADIAQIWRGRRLIDGELCRYPHKDREGFEVREGNGKDTLFNLD